MSQRIREAPVAAGAVPRYRAVERPGNSLGTAALVLGLLGVVLCWVPLVGVLCGLLGVVFGGCGISVSGGPGRNHGVGRGRSVAGLVLGIVSLVPAVVILVAVATSS